MSIRRFISTAALIILTLALTAGASGCGGGDGGGTEEVEVEGTEQAPEPEMVRLGEAQESGPWRITAVNTDRLDSINSIPPGNYEAAEGRTLYLVEFELENTAGGVSTLEVDPHEIEIVDSAGEAYTSAAIAPVATVLASSTIDMDGSAISEAEQPGDWARTDTSSDITPSEDSTLFVSHIYLVSGSFSHELEWPDGGPTLTISATAIDEITKKWTVQLSGEGLAHVAVAFNVPSDAQMTELLWPELQPISLPTTDGETPAAGEPPATDGGGLQELRALAGQAAESVIAKVTFRISTEFNGETMEEEYVLVQRPPDYRFEKDFVQEGGVEIHDISITVGANSYTCPRAAGYVGNCYEAEPIEPEALTAPLDGFLSMPQEVAEAEGVVIVDTSQRTIAGVDATCFKVNTPPDIGEAEFCFSDEGLPLYIHAGEGGEGLTFEITSVSMDVTDADFELPYTLRDFFTGEELEDPTQ